MVKRKSKVKKEPTSINLKIRTMYEQGGDPIKLFREQNHYLSFVDFLFWLEDNIEKVITKDKTNDSD